MSEPECQPKQPFVVPTNKKWWHVNPNIVLLAVPALLLVYMIFRLVEIHSFYYGWYDPVYAYLMNGLTFALGSTDIGHLDHPGTPLQLFCGLLIRVVALFRGVGSGTLSNDVINHPELYLRVIALSLVVLNCWVIWFLGVVANRRFKNRGMAVVMQLLPLTSFVLVMFLPIVACESVVILASVGVAAVLILYDSRKESQWALVVMVAFLSALSVSTKVSSMLILIIPFFFFKGIKPKVVFSLFTLLFVFLLVLPVLGKLGHFVGFIKGLFTHTGIYGSGEEKLIDWSIFFHSLKKMTLKEIPFTLHLLLIPVGWIFITKRKINGAMLRLYIGITLATIFQMLLVARHYSFHYLMPIMALVIPLHGYFWLSLGYGTSNRWFQNNGRWLTGASVLFVFTALTINNKFDKGIVTPVSRTATYMAQVLNAPLVIISQSSIGGALPDQALHFGLAYSGASVRSSYTSIVAGSYKQNYCWTPNEGFYSFTRRFLPAELFADTNEVFAYAYIPGNNDLYPVVEEMTKLSGLKDFVKVETVYSNPESGEKIFRMTADTVLLHHQLVPVQTLRTSMEKLSVDGTLFAEDSGSCFFRGGEHVSAQYARSGKASMRMPPGAYGLDVVVPVVFGQKFRAVIWFKQKGCGQIPQVVSSNNNVGFYRSSANVAAADGGWQKTELLFTLPENYPDSTLSFYVWNPGRDTVWVDDLSVTIYP